MSHTRDIEHLKITLEAINSATNNFAADNCIGRGGFGKVYKGEIVHSEGQSMVAIKRLDRKFGQGNSEFWREITMLYCYKHENLVHLLGFCDESDEKILVYEFLSNMGLDLHLNNNDLTWTQRLKICIGMARGLAYLHNSFEAQLRVLHRDVKSSNILLDEDWNAKISDFGLSKFAPATNFTFLYTSVVGTPGYCDPLYMETGLLTKESDVYSLGVVLFEVLCGRLCFSRKDDRPLIVLARQCYKLNNVDTIIFANIRNEIDPNSLRAFTTIAYRCLKRDREERPLINDVVRMLATALGYQLSQVVASPSASRMATANPSMPHATVEAGPPGLVQPLVAAAFLKHSRTPPSGPGMEYQMADSEHLMKRASVGPSYEESSSGSFHPPNVYAPEDLPKTVLRTLHQGSSVTSMDFHPQQQTILLAGTNAGEISIWEVGARERVEHKLFKVWDLFACSMPFQTTLVKDAAVSVNRCIWGPDGSILGVAFSKHIVQIYTYNQSGELRQHLEIDAHVGGVNDIAFAQPNKQLCIVTCGDDKTIKVWDAVGGRRLYMFEGHEAPVYFVCPHSKEQIQFIFSTAIDGKIKAWLYDCLGSRVDYDALWCTTMAYSTDGTRLFSCGTSKEGEAHLIEWNESEGAIKREYSGFKKRSMGVVQFDTTRNRFLAAGDEFQIKFWDMDNNDMLTATGPNNGLPARPRLRFNKEGSLLAVSTSDNGFIILANGDGQRMVRVLESQAYERSRALSDTVKGYSVEQETKRTAFEEEPVVQIDLSCFPGNLRRDDNENGRDCWRILDGNNFRVRSKRFCYDKSKMPGGKPLMDLVAVDWFKDTKRMDHVARRPGCAAQIASQKGHFCMVFNVQVPGSTNYSMVFYFVSKELTPGSLLQWFVDGDDEFRNSRMKLIPYVPKGSWIVRQSVGSTPCLLGKAVDCNYIRGTNYLEVDVDIGSTTVANSLLGLVVDVITSLVFDMAFLVQANTTDELPERLIGAVRVSHLELSSAIVPKLEPDPQPS